MVFDIDITTSSLISELPYDKIPSLIWGVIVLVICAWILFPQRFNRKPKAQLPSNNLWIKSPLIKSEWLSSFVGNSSTVHLKLEALQPSGSFKIRGISTFMKHQHSLNNKIDCFVTTSSANAGMAVAYTAFKLNCRCMVILDKSQEHNELLSIFKHEYAAEIIFHGSTWNEADEYALKLCSDTDNICYVPMFDDPLIFTGHSTIINELSQQYEKNQYPDCIIVSVGGGGLINGILEGLDKAGRSRYTKVVAAQSEHCSLFECGIRNTFKPIAMKCITCDGVDLGYRAISKKSMDLAEEFNTFNSIKCIVVKDVDVLNVCTLFAEREHVMIEPLCGVAVAALYKNRDYFKRFSNICIIVCGGNHVYYNKDLLQRSNVVDDKVIVEDVQDID